MVAVLHHNADPVGSGLPRPPELDPAKHALFLDLDGTLSPIRSRPDDVGPEPELSALLERLVRCFNGAVAVVSGRAVADVERITEGVVTALAGVHGLERRLSDGRLTRAEPSPALAHGAEILRSFAANIPGLLVEDKGLAVTLHWRMAPEQQSAAQAIAADLAARTGLTLQNGDHVAELKTPGADKGAAVAAFLCEVPFSGRTPVFVGDDLTDEHGFRAAAVGGGFGVLVGSERPTAASYRLADVADVRTWLGRAA